MKLYIFSVLIFLISQVLAKKIQNKLDNKVTFVGGITDGLDVENLQCDVDISKTLSYVAVSERVFNITKACDNNYVVGMASIPEEVSESGNAMFKARIVDKCVTCNEAQVVLDFDTYKNFTRAEEKANIIWMVINDKGESSLKANYMKFHNFTEFVGIPPEEIKRLFEARALEMVENDINLRGWPWEGDISNTTILETNSTLLNITDTTTLANNSTIDISNSTTTVLTNVTYSSSSFNSTENVATFVDESKKYEEAENGSHGLIFVSAVGAAAVGLACFAGYKKKSSLKKDLKREDSIAIPSLPAVDSSINSISDHPDGLPRIDIYNPPLEYYHFPMDTSYDIADQEFYED